jgi:hypothetical protein
MGCEEDNDRAAGSARQRRPNVSNDPNDPNDSNDPNDPNDYLFANNRFAGI